MFSLFQHSVKPRFIFLIVTVVMLASGGSFSTSVIAAEYMSKPEVEKFLAGNTIRGKQLRWGYEYKTYFDKSGRWSRIDDKGLVSKGDWEVNDKGYLLISPQFKDKQKIRTIAAKGDGTFEVYNARDQVIWTIDKVDAGNPDKLK